MVTLSCNVNDCVNNEGGLCGASYIEIQGEGTSKKEDTYCSNYKLNTFINGVKSLTNTDFVGEILQVMSGYEKPIIHPNVSCNAYKCFYNGDGKCEARSIMIVEDKLSQVTKTSCNTFQV